MYGRDKGSSRYAGLLSTGTKVGGYLQLNCRQLCTLVETVRVTINTGGSHTGTTGSTGEVFGRTAR